MSLFVLLVSIVTVAEPRCGPGHDEAADRSRKEAPPAAVKVGEANVRRLIERLASPSYQEREAATRGLAALGERALPALKKAAASKDPEVKRRATQLLKPLEAKVRIREMGRIVASKLSPQEKGRQLKGLITEGMSYKELERVLGECHDGSGSANTTDGSAALISNYREYGLQISATRKAGQEHYLVSFVRLIGD